MNILHAAWLALACAWAFAAIGGLVTIAVVNARDRRRETRGRARSRV